MGLSFSTELIIGLVSSLYELTKVIVITIAGVKTFEFSYKAIMGVATDKDKQEASSSVVMSAVYCLVPFALELISTPFI